MPRPARPRTSTPRDAVIGPAPVRLAPAALSLSERAAEHLRGGPCDPHTLMRLVCRVDRLQPDAAARMAEVLLGRREQFVQLDDDRWALVEAGQVRRDESTGRVDAPTPAADPTALDRAHFAVVDVETTGSQPGLWDRVTEIAIVPVDGLVVGAPWSRLVHPGRPIPPMITALTGISNAMVATAPTFADLADEVTAHLEGRIFTAHNALFDHRFVEAELVRARALRLGGTRLCTVQLTRRLVPALTRRSLDRVSAYFGVPVEGRHRAGGDALATAHVLVRLLEIAQERGITSWPALLGLLSPAARRRPGRASARSHPVREDHTA
jgi:DNA polymerase-3 subunit epsilon